MEIGNFVNNIQERVTSSIDAARQAVSESAKAQNTAAIKQIQDSFDGIDLRTLDSVFDPIVAPEAEFLGPATFFQDLAQTVENLSSVPGLDELMTALAEPAPTLENELNALAEILESILQNINIQGAGDEIGSEIPQQREDLRALREMQTGVENLVQLQNQASGLQFGSGIHKLEHSNRNSSPLSQDFSSHFLKQQLNNSIQPSFSGNPFNVSANQGKESAYSIESSNSFGVKNYSGSGGIPAYGSQGKTIAEGQVGVKFGEVNAQGQGDWGSGYLKGEAFVGARARAFGDVDWSNRTMNIGFEAEAGMRAHYDAGYRTPDAPAGAEFAGSTDAFVGAMARANGEVNFSENPRVVVGGEAFEGAKAGLDLGTGVTIDGNRMVGGHYGVEAWTGIGAGINGDLGFKDGNLRFDFSGGLALLIGAEVSFGFDIGFGDLFRTTTALGKDFLKGIGGTAESVGKELANVAADTAKTAENVAGTAAKAATSVVDTAANAAKDVGKAIGSVISDIF